MDDIQTIRTWGLGLMLAGFQLLFVALICYFRLVVELYRRREYGIAILFTAFFMMVGGGWTLGVLAGLPVGWRYARDWGIRPWMVVWSIALACGSVNIGLAVWIKEMSVEQWHDRFGWLPRF